MQGTNKEICNKLLLTHSEWTKVHRYLKGNKKGLTKSKSEKKIPKFSLISTLKSPQETPEGPREYNTLEKEIKEWEALEHMKNTNKNMFRKFVNQKKRPEDINRWLFELGIKQSLTQEKKHQMRKMLDARNIYPFHPNLTTSTRNLIKTMRAEEGKSRRSGRVKNKTFKEKTNAMQIFNTTLNGVGQGRDGYGVGREELEDSWDFPMEMELNVNELGKNKEYKNSLIRTDFLHLMASNKLHKPLKGLLNKTQYQNLLTNKWQLAKKKNLKSKSTPRKTMYAKGRRPRQIENKLLNLIGESRVPNNLAKRKDKPLKTIPLPVPNRGTIISREPPKLK
jgi:hypothetical protein